MDSNPIQLDLIDSGWPVYEWFSYNNHNQNYHVEEQVEFDLLATSSPLIITGYASLDKLLGFFVHCKQSKEKPKEIRLLLGHEPLFNPKESYPTKNIQLSQSIIDYWLEHKISLYKSMQILITIDMIKNGELIARIGDERNPLHAKIYKGDSAITLGSSNFSNAGLRYQTEANVRFVSCQQMKKKNVQQKENKAFARGKEGAEQERFEEACRFAEMLWSRGQDYGDNLLKLLQQLLQTVTWQEALARSCAEVLEGTWARHYISQTSFQTGSPLWPSQEQGIAQAMWLIEHVGSVLIADATGSGKTQMGANLIKAVMNRIWSRGLRRRRDLPVLISPAGVVDEWIDTSDNAGLALKVYSDGILSHIQSKKHDATEGVIRRAQVLAVDEAHRYHNPRSTRTKQIYNNLADNVLLFTATPVNRSPLDLLAIIDLLRADNFEDEVLDVFEHLSNFQLKNGNKDEALSPDDIQKLQKAIQQFTVRRTKTMLNAMIDARPEKYLDVLGRPCRYPTHHAHFYSCGDTDEDQRLAEEIRQLASQLRGLFTLRSPFQLSEFLKYEGVRDEDYLRWRLSAAQSLARYNIMAALRSSRAAVFEHIYGTDAACKEFKFQLKGNKDTGNILQTIQNQTGEPPQNVLRCSLPDWLVEPEAHFQASEQEILCYQKIAELLKQMSNTRENTKVELLLSLQKTHPLLIAFDHTVITLFYLAHQLDQKCLSFPVQLAIGNDESSQKKVKELLQLESTATAGIALCSDSMSEGLNLQQASAIIHLDMPSVVRIAEQRVGRIDRMNSPHRTTASYWPEESSAFALRSDQRFYMRYQFVSDVLGSNLTLPSLEETNIVRAQDLAKAVEQGEQEQKGWQTISDAFEPVRNLISGPVRLIKDRQIYENLRHSKTRVLSSVSAVYSSHPWAFFAIAGTEWGAPRWVYLASPEANPMTDLEHINHALRDRFEKEDIRDRHFDEPAALWLDRFLQRLNCTEQQLLPKKKQRALYEMRKVLSIYARHAGYHKDASRQTAANNVLALFNANEEGLAVDWNTLADCLLDLIRPHWYNLLQKKRKSSRPLQLKDLHQPLIDTPLSTEQLQEIMEERLWTQKLDKRIVSAILGIPDGKVDQ